MIVKIKDKKQQIDNNNNNRIKIIDKKIKKSYQPRVKVRGNSYSKKKTKLCLKTWKVVSLKDFEKLKHNKRSLLKKKKFSFKI